MISFSVIASLLFIGLLAIFMLAMTVRLVAGPISERMHNYKGPEWVEVLFCRLGFSNRSTCKDVDDIVNAAIESDSYIDNGWAVARFTSCEIWIASWPYAYGNINLGKRLLPSAKTRVRLRRYLAAKGVGVWS